MDPAAMGGMNPPQSPVGNAPPGAQVPIAGPPPPSQAPVDPNAAPPQGMDPSVMGIAAPPQPPEKPPSLIPTAIAKQLAEALNVTKLAAAQGLAQHLGDPRGNVNAKDADMLRAWRKRNPDIDPLYEKIVNKKSDEDILMMMYPLRRALIRYGRRTYTEQVDFAEKMARLDKDPRFANLTNNDEVDDYEPPHAKFPSRGEEEPVTPNEEERIPSDKGGY
jgi:hypothetical protein